MIHFYRFSRFSIGFYIKGMMDRSVCSLSEQNNQLLINIS